MRIHDRNLTSTSAAQAGRAQDAQKVTREGTDQAGTATNASGDRVELSTTLARLSRAIASNGADRSAKVQALAAQYQSGQYRPNSPATSRAMVSDALSSGVA